MLVNNILYITIAMVVITTFTNNYDTNNANEQKGITLIMTDHKLVVYMSHHTVSLTSWPMILCSIKAFFYPINPTNQLEDMDMVPCTEQSC